MKNENKIMSDAAFEDFKSILRRSQEDLKKHLVGVLKASGYKDIKCEDGFLYAKGTAPILLVAHLDTVYKESPQEINRNGNLLSSPQGIGGDDRCGVYIIKELLGEKPSVLFCEDEETGGRGANKFAKTDYIKNLNVKFIVEFDRRGSSDAVFYNCDNPKFENLVTQTTGFKTSYGTFSDISILAPNAKLAAVNLSSGYYSEHTQAREQINLSEMMGTIEAGRKLIDAAKSSESFEYIPRRVYEFGNYYGSNWNYGSMDSGLYKTSRKKATDLTVTVSVSFLCEDGGYDEGYGEGKTKGDAWFDFFSNNPTVCFNDIDDYVYE